MLLPCYVHSVSMTGQTMEKCYLFVLYDKQLKILSSKVL